MEWLQSIPVQEICNLIILMSAVIIASKNIYSFFKKPVDDIQERARVNEEQRIEQVLEDKIPPLLQKNCEVIMGSLDELKEMTIDQEGQLTQMQESLDLLSASQLDILRYNMNKLYYKYRPYRKMLNADKKAFIKLYNDYKLMHGNTWIDALYAEVKDWPIVEDEQELHW